MVDIVTRAQWGANYTSGFYTVPMREKDEFFVHYHGGVPAASVGVWVPRNVEAIHHANGWSGVGYSFVVDQAGTIYEGRGWDGVCVACPDHNRRGIHVYVAVGGTQEATDAAKRSVVALRDEHRRLRALKSLSRPAEFVHGDKYPTACAGPTLTPWVHAGMPITTVPQEDDMADPATIKAIAEAVWAQKLDDPRTPEADGTTAARWLTYANIKAGNAGSIDVAALVDALRADVIAAVKEGVAQGQTPEVVADAVVERFGSKLAAPKAEVQQ